MEEARRHSPVRGLDRVMEFVRHAVRELTRVGGAILVLRAGDRCFYAEEEAIEPVMSIGLARCDPCIDFSLQGLLHRADDEMRQAMRVRRENSLEMQRRSVACVENPATMRVRSTLAKNELRTNERVVRGCALQKCGENTTKNATRCARIDSSLAYWVPCRKKLLIIFPLACRFFLDIVAA